MNKKRFYFDYAASTPVDPRVEAAMRPYFLKKFGNAGSLHSFGQEASSAMDNAREIIAKAINANFREVIFTGSATEANNLALRGSMRRFTQMIRGLTQINISDNQRKISEYQRPRLIVSAIEHESVLETARDLKQDGIEVVYVPVDRNGIVKLDELKSALNERTILVSVMYANNEIGSIQPISEIAKLIEDFRNRNFQFSNSNFQKNSNNPITQLPNYYPLFHTDAVQAFQFLDCDVNRLGVDLMTLSAHKIYGPKGVGMLYINSKLQNPNDKQNPNYKNQNSKNWNLEFDAWDLPAVSPLVTGGNQEFGMRSGTENIPLIVGFAKAVELLFSYSRESENKRIAELRDYFWKELKKIHPATQTNPENMTENRKSFLPNMLNIYFPDHEAQYLLTKFDLAGIAVSAGSACSARSAEPSYVITALGYPEKRARRSIRFSFGRPTRKEDIDSALRVIRKLL